MTPPPFVLKVALQVLLDLAVSGAKALNKLNKDAREKLIRVYRETIRNKKALEVSGCLNTPRLNRDEEAFISVVKVLSNTELAPLFKINKRGMFYPDTKKKVKQRKTQYAINYVVTQIDVLKDLIQVKRNKNAPALRLGIRLNTLYKHLSTLEKVLYHLGKK